MFGALSSVRVTFELISRDREYLVTLSLSLGSGIDVPDTRSRIKSGKNTRIA